MNKLPIWFSGLAIALLPVVCSALVVIPTSSSLQMTANSNVVSNVLTDSTTITDTDSDAQSGTINPLSVSVSALATSAGGSIDTTGDATVTWVDPAQAQLIWNVAWVTNNVPGTNGSLANVSAIGPGDGWTYTFTADQTGFFTLDFNISIGGSDTFGLNGFNFQWFVPGDPLPVTDFMPVGTSGTITQPITAGDSFTVRITNNSGFFSTGAISNRNANMTGAFDWQILSDDIVVDIDIKFCSDPNAFNCRKRGVLPVTIFGTASFDPLDIDPSTLRLCRDDTGACTAGAPIDFSIADRGDPTSDLGASMCAIDPASGLELHSLNPDGFLDFDAAFDATEVQTLLGDFCGGMKNEVSSTLVITGSTFGGIPISSAPVNNTGIDQLVKKGK